MNKGPKLKKGQIEIIWPNNSFDVIQTSGMTYTGAAIVLTVDGHHVIIPMTSVKRFRVAEIQ